MSAERLDFQGLAAVRWSSVDGASATATLQGAQVVSWRPAGGRERLFLSERSAFEAGRAIRGGIPVCFPQFADRGPLPQHGFARVQPWALADVSDTGQGARATFVLAGSAPMAAWPFAFRLELAVTVGATRLETELRVANPGREAFAFTAALHTYLCVTDPAASLHGLQGVRYVERGSTAIEREGRDRIPATAAIDRVYFAAPSETRLDDGGAALRITQEGFTDTVVWNPGEARAAQMPDMAPGGYLRMLCVEAAAIEPAVILAPGARWSGRQALSA